MINPTRRGFLTGSAALVTAIALARGEVLLPIEPETIIQPPIPPPRTLGFMVQRIHHAISYRDAFLLIDLIEVLGWENLKATPLELATDAWLDIHVSTNSIQTMNGVQVHCGRNPAQATLRIPTARAHSLLPGDLVDFKFDAKRPVPFTIASA